MDLRSNQLGQALECKIGLRTVPAGTYTVKPREYIGVIGCTQGFRKEK